MSLSETAMLVTPESATLRQEPWLENKVVLILCGLIASGKVRFLAMNFASCADKLLTQSTFAEQLEHHYPHFRRCNQDDLGDRRQVERMARETLARGQSVCIDRTNFNPQ